MIRHAAITGLAPVSALGLDAASFWEALTEGRSGLRRMSNAPPTTRCTVAAEVDLPHPSCQGLNPVPRAVQLALEAARRAWHDAGLQQLDRARVGLVVGAGIGNLDLLEQGVEDLREKRMLSPIAAFRAYPHAAACEILRELDLRGPVQTVTSGCNSGADAVGLALDWIRLGRADVVLAGGTEAELTPTFLGAMTSARALAVRYNDRPAEASRPFSRHRDGNVPGEGAAFVVLETPEHAARRGATPRAHMAGFVNRATGNRPPYDPFNPVFDTTPLKETMRLAMADAGLQTVDAVSANGSSSVFYDILEAQAICELLGENIPVHSVKGGLGQTGAVTPVLQIIAAALSLQHRTLPPTINVGEQEARCPVRLVRDAAAAFEGNAILCNAIGFGGFYHAATCLTR
ncbi:MAG: beta-ketoacyl-[acyl-carrier-protein] synthase family protein [Candidatus Xenobia bacterium]